MAKRVWSHALVAAAFFASRFVIVIVYMAVVTIVIFASDAFIGLIYFISP